MSTLHDLRDIMGENVMPTGVWSFYASAEANVPRDFVLHTILGDQRLSFNLTGETVALAVCHDNHEGAGA